MGLHIYANVCGSALSRRFIPSFILPLQHMQKVMAQTDNMHATQLQLQLPQRHPELNRKEMAQLLCRRLQMRQKEQPQLLHQYLKRS